MSHRRLALCSLVLFTLPWIDGALLAQIPRASVERIRQDLSFLSSDALAGRDSGEPGLEVAAEYLASRFRALGLEPAGDHGSYFQHFSVPGGADFAGVRGVEIQRPGTNLLWQPGADCEALAHGKQDGVESSDAGSSLVFAGYGITTSDEERAQGLDYDDYAGLDVEGKIVLVLRFTPRFGDEESAFRGRRSPHAPFVAKLENARRHGARAVIFVTPPGAEEEDLRGLAHRAAPGQPTLPAILARRDAVNALVRFHGASLESLVERIDETLQPASFPLEGVTAAFRTERRYLRLRNVVARLPGQDSARAKQTIVVGGHYDHIGRFGNQVSSDNIGEIHNGADDNASGTAGVLEVAELLTRIERPARSFILMGFSGEEIGLHGSRHWVSAPRVFRVRDYVSGVESREPDAKAVLLEPGTTVTASGRFLGGSVEVSTAAGERAWIDPASLEQIAGTTPVHDVVAMINLDMIGRGAPGKPVEIIGANSGEGFDTLLERLAKDVEQPVRPTGGLVGGGSDHSSFQQRGIPVMFFHTGMHREYNTPEDDLETIDLDATARVVDLAFRAAVEIANAAEPPVFQRASVARVDRNRSRPLLGVQIDPGYEGEGVRVADVVPDMPADRAGVLAGDVLRAIGAHEVKSVLEIRAALDAEAKGDVALSIVRAGRELTLSASFPKPEAEEPGTPDPHGDQAAGEAAGGSGGGFRVRFGSVPDYAFEGRGVRFDDIQADSPAAKAGVRPGDVLVRWQGKRVEDVESWTALLREARPDQKVKLVVDRDGKRVEMEATLEAR